MADIFISYTNKNRSLAEALASQLEAVGYSVWWDFDLIGGSDFRNEIEQNLDAAKAVIVLWTSDAVGSRFVKDEADHALRSNKLIPVRVNDLDVNIIPLGHRGLQTYLIDDTQRILAALVALGLNQPGPNPRQLALNYYKEAEELKDEADDIDAKSKHDVASIRFDIEKCKYDIARLKDRDRSVLNIFLLTKVKVAADPQLAEKIFSLEEQIHYYEKQGFDREGHAKIEAQRLRRKADRLLKRAKELDPKLFR